MMIMMIYSPNKIHDPASEFEPHRDPGRPHTRWDDLLQNFYSWRWPEFENEHWSETMNRVNAIKFEDEFVAFAVQHL